MLTQVRTACLRFYSSEITVANIEVGTIKGTDNVVIISQLKIILETLNFEKSGVKLKHKPALD